MIGLYATTERIYDSKKCQVFLADLRLENLHFVFGLLVHVHSRSVIPSRGPISYRLINYTSSKRFVVLTSNILYVHISLLNRPIVALVGYIPVTFLLEFASSPLFSFVHFPSQCCSSSQTDLHVFLSRFFRHLQQLVNVFRCVQSF